MKNTIYHSWPDLNQSFNKLKTEIMKKTDFEMKNELEERIVNISKAGAYDILTESYSKLKAEHEALKTDLKEIYKVFLETEPKDIIDNPTQLTGKVLKILINNSKLWSI